MKQAIPPGPRTCTRCSSKHWRDGPLCIDCLEAALAYRAPRGPSSEEVHDMSLRERFGSKAKEKGRTA